MVLSAWPGCGAEPVEGLGEVGGPGPVLVQAQDQAVSGADEPAGDVQGAVAQPVGFEFAEGAGEAEGLGPGREVRCGQGELDPPCVGVEVLAGQAAKPAVFGVADPVFHPGVLALPEFQGCDVVPAGGGVGEQDLETVAVEVGESVLRAGVGTFAAADDPRADRPRS